MKSARFLVVVLLLWSQLSVAQKQAHPPRPIAGTVVDAVTNVPVPKALVVGSRGSTWTDEQGAFSFAGLAPAPYRLRQPEAVWVSAPGYESRQWPLVDTAKPVIQLRARRHAQSAPLCVSVGEAPAVRTCESAWFFGGGRPGQKGYQSLYFENPQPHQPGIIRSITFDIARTGFRDVPFRLRVHAVSASGAPGSDILTENLVLCLYPDPFRKDSFVIYDISDYAIPAPESGFYLGLEAVEMWERPCTQEPIAGSGGGLVARPPCAFAQCRSWTWRSGQTDIRGDWTPLAENCWPRFEEALSVEVGPVPTKR
ncbi:carboxypeptidase-like regulatory domain-containing protein [Hymenobacter glaciei]|uniref:carboxypeptidase-like regulatory domain-containing protein n=1 Tax=Hymenobacter glaciei TaxID=877209 RepID=UPI0031E60DC6